jgi:VCBS repeat-containing protein
MDDNTIGRIDDLQDDSEVLIVRASGETMIARQGDSIFVGDIVVASNGSSVVIQIDKSHLLNASGFVVVGSTEVAIFDKIFFEQNAALIVSSIKENPSTVGFHPSFDIAQLFNAIQVGGAVTATVTTGTVTADGVSRSIRLTDITIDGNIEDILPPTSGGSISSSIVSAPFVLNREDPESIPGSGRLQDLLGDDVIVDVLEDFILRVPEIVFPIKPPDTLTDNTDVPLIDTSTVENTPSGSVTEDVALLTINIAGNNDTGEGSNHVLEASSATETGIITVTSSNGIQTLTVGGQSVLGVTSTDVLTHVVLPGTGTYGALTITNFDSINNIVSYSYTESGTAKTHGPIVDSFAIVLTDNVGNSATSNTRIDFTINDTAPSATNDTNTINEGATAVSVTTITGNVTGGVGLSAGDVVDTLVDLTSNPVTAANLTGLYGSVVLLSDGQYTYTLDNTNPAVQGLTLASIPLIETFTYTSTDGDGSTATAT